MTVLGWIILIIVAAIVGAIGEAIAGVKVPGGWLGSIVVGFIGAWIGARVLHFGPVLRGIQIIPAIIGAIVFVFALRLVMGGTRRTTA